MKEIDLNSLPRIEPQTDDGLYIMRDEDGKVLRFSVAEDSAGVYYLRDYGHYTGVSTEDHHPEGLVDALPLLNHMATAIDEIDQLGWSPLPAAAAIYANRISEILVKHKLKAPQ